jgi:hypothetical protein
MQTCAHSSKGLCPVCFRKKYTKKPINRKPNKPLKRAPLKHKPYKIKKVSLKRSDSLKEYRVESAIFIKENPVCGMNLPGCTKKATQVHHKKGRENDLLLKKEFWMPGCDSCHTWCTEHSKEAIELGLSISRHKISTDKLLTVNN